MVEMERLADLEQQHLGQKEATSSTASSTESGGLLSNFLDEDNSSGKGHLAQAADAMDGASDLTTVLAQGIPVS